MKTNLRYLILIVLAFSFQTSRAQNYFLKVTGPEVLGESVQSGHIGEIFLKGFDFSILNNINFGSESSGGRAGKASSGPINLTFEHCAGATEFFKRLHSGDIFAEFKITAQASSASGDFDYLVYTFKSVKVSNFESEYQDGDEIITHKLSVKAGTLKIEYTPLNGLGEPDNTKNQTAVWSFIKNKASEEI